MKVDVNIIDGKVWIGGQTISASLSVANGQIVAISEKKFLKEGIYHLWFRKYHT